MDAVGPKMQEDSLSAKTKPMVLLIHPDGSVENVCRQALEKHGFDLETVSDGSNGLHRIYQTIPDVIVVGSATPELNGYQICRVIKNDPVMKRIPVILVADVAEKMDRFWGVKAGSDDFLQKDELEAKLLKKIQMLLEIYDRMDIAEKQKLKIVHEKTPLNIRARLNQIMDTSLVESTLMVEFRSLADLVHDVSLLNYMLFSLLESIIDYDAAAIFYNDEGKAPRLVTFHFPEGERVAKAQVEKMTERFFRPFKGHGLTDQQLELVESEVIGTLEDETETDDITDGIEDKTLPIAYQTVYLKEVKVEGRLLGAICLYAKQKVDYPRIFPTQLVEDEIRLLMKLRHLYSQAELLAVSDNLTGLFNQKHFLTVLQREFKSSQRYELNLSLALIAIDNFRRLNDEWGHTCGDDVLRQIARIAETAFRGVDVLARFGGKYLAVLLPKTSEEQALIALQRFQQKVVETRLEWENEPLRVSISAGLVSLNEKIATVPDLLKQVDNSLQQARSHGNRIEISQG